jgi:mRNA interferase RelE/StbE
LAHATRNDPFVPGRRVSGPALCPIIALALDPRPPGSTIVAGSECWRIRVGNLRLVYAIADDAWLVVVLRVARRDEAYRRLER